MAKKNVEKDEEIGLEKKSLIRTDSESSSTSSTFNQGKIFIFKKHRDSWIFFRFMIVK